MKAILILAITLPWVALAAVGYHYTKKPSCESCNQKDFGIYMNYDNLSIKGDVSLPGYEGWISFNDISMATNRYISSSSSASGWGMEEAEDTAKPNKKVNININEISLSKAFDSATGALTAQTFNTDPDYAVNIEIHIVDLRKGLNKPLIVYRLGNASIYSASSFSYSQGSEPASEAYSVKYLQFEAVYFNETDSVEVVFDAQK